MKSREPEPPVLSLDAGGSFHPHGNGLRFEWFLYPEPGRTLPWLVTLAGDKSPVLRVAVDRRLPPGEIHLILRVIDEGDPPLCAYRRVVLRHLREVAT